VRGKKLAPSETLFLGKFGDRMTPSSLRQMVKRASRRADVEKAPPHRFRHTFAINFLRNGGSVLELKEMLGHEKLETVLIYARLAEVDLKMAQRRSNVADTCNL
jgi:integrase/recombinase XerD